MEERGSVMDNANFKVNKEGGIKGRRGTNESSEIMALKLGLSNEYGNISQDSFRFL